MIVFKVAIGLIVVVAFIFSVFKLNAYSEENYSYTPIQGTNILFGFIPWILVLAGNYGEIHGEHKSLALGLLVAFLVLYGLFLHIAKQSSPGVAVGAVVIILVLNVVIIVLAMGREASRNNDYYYDDD